MIYDSLDTIPLKVYLKIDKTNNVSLLTDDVSNLDTAKLRNIWKQLRKEYNELGVASSNKKILDVHIRVETLRTKHDYIISACNYLNFDRNQDLENELREWGYKLREESYIDDLNRIKREASAILVQVDRLELQIERKSPKKTNNSKRTLDQLIIGYMSATGVHYDTNKITVTQFHALQELFKDKLRELEKNKARARSKSKPKKR